MVAIGLGASVISADWFPKDPRPWLPWAVLIGVVGLSLAVIAADVLVREKQLDVISSVYFGTIVGLFLAYVVGLALAPLPSGRSIGPRSIWPWASSFATSASACCCKPRTTSASSSRTSSLPRK